MTVRGKISSSPIAVTDDELLALGFEMIGISAKVLKGRSALIRFFKDNEGELPHVVFVNERVAEEIRDYREDLLRRGKVSPVFAVVPDMEGCRGIRLKELSSLLAKALGTEELRF
ncbi:MAG: hypothetical protein BA066_00020 [Candidatus Korarchaeota archaeon NZ13-K]|nr:MAG: hypothetical protein BA066_00020 [Candidatus Korarchaeota archaeon NZ13-K]